MTQPQRLGKYEILEELGRGGFATVYKARDTGLNRLVALKLLSPHFSQDPGLVSRFRQEAQLAAGLDHPNIVTIYEAGEVDGRLYIAMKYLPGRSLRDVLAVEGALPLARALPILGQVAGTLDYAHSHNIIHRDVKPANIMVEETAEGPQATLTDFGLVKALSEGSSLTSLGTTVGSPEYMAPEQADPNRAAEVGPATDRYALGIIAYEMLTGRVPFPGNTPATLYAHEHKPPPSPRELRTDLPEPAAQALLKMLAKAPAGRYSTAQAFVAALQPASPSPIRPARPFWFWSGLAVGVIALVALLGLGLYGLIGRLTPIPSPTDTTVNSEQGAIIVKVGGEETATVPLENGATAVLALKPLPGATATRQMRSTATVPPPTPTRTPTAAPSATPTLPPIPVVAGDMQLLEPNDQVLPNGTRSVKFLWQRGQACNLPDGQGFLLRLWKEGSEPLGAMDAVTQQEEISCGGGTYAFMVGDLPTAPGALGATSGRFYWDVILVDLFAPEIAQAAPLAHAIFDLAGPEDTKKDRPDSSSSDPGGSVPLPTPTWTPTAAPSATPTLPPIPVVLKDNILLLEPNDQVLPNGTRSVKFLWLRGQACDLPAGQGFLLRLWKEGSEPLGAMDAVTQQGEISCGGGTYAFVVGDLSTAPGAFGATSGRFYWDVILVGLFAPEAVQAEPQAHAVFDLGSPGDSESAPSDSSDQSGLND